MRKTLKNILQQEDLNFLLTNRIPRQLLTRFVGWFSQIEHPLVKTLSIKTWQFFSDLDLSEALKSDFSSMHDCFTRQLKAGARPIEQDPKMLSSPCDAIIGAFGQVTQGQVFQAKGFPYPLADLIPDPTLAQSYEGGSYVTLRLTSSMYHRFHAPYAAQVKQVTYIAGDTWNVNPIALQRIEKLFCKNERAVIECELDLPQRPKLTLVPVAAILVASIRLHFLEVLLHMGYKGPQQLSCDAHFQKGEEMGWFQHGSTIIVFAPPGFDLLPHWQVGDQVRMGQGLMRVVT